MKPYRLTGMFLVVCGSPACGSDAGVVAGEKLGDREAAFGVAGFFCPIQITRCG